MRNNNNRLFLYLANTYAIFELEEVRRVHIQSYVNFLAEQGRKESNKKIETVSSKGKVTIKKKGKVTITITSAANKNCSKVSKKITVTIK